MKSALQPALDLDYHFAGLKEGEKHHANFTEGLSPTLVPVENTTCLALVSAGVLFLSFRT